MQKIILNIICFTFFSCAIAQNSKSENNTENKINYTISNSEKVITNEMIFWPPYDFEKNTKPLFLVNGNKVECITYYQKEEIKSIIVLQPKDAIAKYKSRGKNGVVLVTLKQNGVEPTLDIITNKKYYNCLNENNIKDTTKAYYDKVSGKNCTTLNLKDTSKMQTVYINFNNEIHIKNLGVGWDRTSISMSGGSMSGSGNNRMIRVTKKGIATIIIGRLVGNKNVSTVIKLKVEDLPKWN